MPFTLAHPAAVLPLRGLRHLEIAPLSSGHCAGYSVLRAGSFGHSIPDTHEFVGSYTTCLLLGYLALLAIFALRRPLTALLSPRARWLCLHAMAPFRSGRSAWPFAGVATPDRVESPAVGFVTHAEGWIVHRVAARVRR